MAENHSKQLTQIIFCPVQGELLTWSSVTKTFDFLSEPSCVMHGSVCVFTGNFTMLCSSTLVQFTKWFQSLLLVHKTTQLSMYKKDIMKSWFEKS